MNKRNDRQRHNHKLENQEQGELNMNSEASHQIHPEKDHSSIGVLLKSARSKKNLSLKVIGHHTKINTTNLEFLEDDRLEKLPNRAYVIGFVKSYAKTVDLNEDHALKALDFTYRKLHLPIHQPSVIIPPQEKSPQSSLKKRPLPAKQNNKGLKAFALLMVFSVILLFFIVANSSKEKSLEVKVATTEITPQTLTEHTPLKEGPLHATDEQNADESGDHSATAPGATSLKAETLEENKIKLDTPLPKDIVVKEVNKEEVNKEEVEEKKEVKKEEVEVKKEAKKEEIDQEEVDRSSAQVIDEIEFHSVGTSLYTVDNSLNQEELNDVLPEKFHQSVVDGKQNVFVNALEGDSWITYKSDDGPIKKFVLKQGRTLLVRGELVRFFIGNVNVTKIFLNNQPLKIVSRSGVKSLIFPQESAADFQLPLFIYRNDGTVITSDEFIAQSKNKNL